MTRQQQLDAAAASYIKVNPYAWIMFVRFTFAAISKGHKNFGVKSIFERIRWEATIENADELDFKINNNHAPYFARKFMLRYPEHKGFFRTRTQISKDWPSTDLPPLTPQDYQEKSPDL
jgi:hypothetical protein